PNDHSGGSSKRSSRRSRTYGSNRYTEWPPGQFPQWLLLPRPRIHLRRRHGPLPLQNTLGFPDGAAPLFRSLHAISTPTVESWSNARSMRRTSSRQFRRATVLNPTLWPSAPSRRQHQQGLGAPFEAQPVERPRARFANP